MTSPILLIDPKAPPKNSILLYTATDDWYNDSTHRLFIMPGFLVIHVSVLKTEPDDQLEFPLEALPWLVDAIENGFWKKPSDGGLPRDVFHVKTTIAGEELRLGRSNNAGAENVPGFTLCNYSRKSYINERHEQNDVIPDFIMKEGGLFTLLKSVAERYQRGEFGPVSKS